VRKACFQTSIDFSWSGDRRFFSSFSLKIDSPSLIHILITFESLFYLHIRHYLQSLCPQRPKIESTTQKSAQNHLIHIFGAKTLHSPLLCALQSLRSSFSFLSEQLVCGWAVVEKLMSVWDPLRSSSSSSPPQQERGPCYRQVYLDDSDSDAPEVPRLFPFIRGLGRHAPNHGGDIIDASTLPSSSWCDLVTEEDFHNNPINPIFTGAAALTRQFETFDPHFIPNETLLREILLDSVNKNGTFVGDPDSISAFLSVAIRKGFGTSLSLVHISAAEISCSARRCLKIRL